jgi:amino acid transporter
MASQDVEKHNLEAALDAPNHTSDSSKEIAHSDDDPTVLLGYKPELHRNRSLTTLLFQSLAIAAIPFGEGSPLISAIYGGGQLSLFLGWILIMILNSCIGVSLGELASRYPTSGGPSYWSFQVAPRGKVLLAFITGWIWLIGNWTITLSVNFGFASLISACISMVRNSINAPFCLPGQSRSTMKFWMFVGNPAPK